MTSTLEQPTSLHGDEALDIIDQNRDSVEDTTRVDQIEVEFPRLGQQLGSSGLYLARLGDNAAGAFKWRGAFTGAAMLKEQGAESLLVPSAGNHARGTILAAKTLDMKIHVVVPNSAPNAKKEGLRELWDSQKLTIHTIGDSFDESLAWAEFHPEHGALLHPYDDPNVAAGQGTVVDDILSTAPDIKHIVLPVGGGGLLAGVATRLKERDAEHVTIHGAIANGSDSLHRSLKYNKITAASRPNARYGGSAVGTIGRHAMEVCQNTPNLRLVHVSDYDVDVVTQDYEQDRQDLMRESTPNYEPTTLVAVAALSQVARNYPGEPTVVLGTGQNDVLWRAAKQYRSSSRISSAPVLR